MEPGCAGAGSQELPVSWGWIQPCLGTGGVPIWISALHSRPSPAQGISGDAVPRAGGGANEQRQDNEAGTGFLYFRAREEILQLVNLDTISVHFSLCNQPICSSLRISRARPIAGRCLWGTVFIPVCHGRSSGLRTRLAPLPSGPGRSRRSCGHDPSRQQHPAQEKPLLCREGGVSKGLGAVQRDGCDTLISSAFQTLPAHPSSALPQAGKGGLCLAAWLQSLAHPMGC